MPKLRSHWKKAVTVLLSVGIACSTMETTLPSKSPNLHRPPYND